MNIHTDWDKLRPYHINSDQIFLSNEFRWHWIFLPNELWKHSWLLELFGFWIVNKRLLGCVLVSNCDFYVYFLSWFLAWRVEDSRGRYTRKLVKFLDSFCGLILTLYLKRQILVLKEVLQKYKLQAPQNLGSTMERGMIVFPKNPIV